MVQMQKKGHFSNECTEELPAKSDKKGTSLLINKEDSSDKEKDGLLIYYHVTM